MLILDPRQHRKIHTVKRVKRACHHLLRPRTGDDIAVEHERHVLRVTVAGIDDTVPQIILRVGAVDVDRLL